MGAIKIIRLPNAINVSGINDTSTQNGADFNTLDTDNPPQDGDIIYGVIGTGLVLGGATNATVTLQQLDSGSSYRTVRDAKNGTVGHITVSGTIMWIFSKDGNIATPIYYFTGARLQFAFNDAVTNGSAAMDVILVRQFG